MGDSATYGDYYCDALEELHSSFAATKAKMVGKWQYQEGEYEHTYSKVKAQSVLSLPWFYGPHLLS